LINSLHLVLWVMHQDHVSRLSAWVFPFWPYLPSYAFLLPFGLAAFASSSLLFPLGRSAFLTVSLLKGSTSFQTSLGLSRSACVRPNWGGCLLYCGDAGVHFRDGTAHGDHCPVHHRHSRFDDLV
jgi:hypothetical protein